MKSRDTFAPIGPYIVTEDEIKDPHKLPITLTNNGVLSELQHRRHGAQDSALHRMGDIDPYAAARRHSGHRHQPSRSQPVHGRRQDRTDHARAAAPCTSRCATDSSAPGRASPAWRTRRAAPKACTPNRPAANTPSKVAGVTRRVPRGSRPAPPSPRRRQGRPALGRMEK